MLLRTERLELRPLQPDDVDDVFSLMSDREVMAYWDWPPLDDRALIELILESQLGRMAQGEAVYFSARTRPEDVFAGVFDLSDMDPRAGACEVGFMLAARLWGQGLAFEGVRALLIYAAGRGLSRVRARIHAENARSARLLERLGFEEAESLPDYEIRPGVRRDCRCFELNLT